MNITGSFSFDIIDESINFKSLEENLYLFKPTRIVNNGDLVGKFNNIVAPYDKWSYEKIIFNSENIFSELNILLDELMPFKSYINYIKDMYKSVIISCYIRSEYGQIGFSLSNEISRKLSVLELSLDFHILSFGEVEE